MEYEIKLDFEKDNNAVNIFNTLLELHQGIDVYNKALVNCISKDISVYSVVMDIEKGSIKVKLQDIVKRLPHNELLEKFIDIPSDAIKSSIKDILIKGKDVLFEVSELDASQFDKEEFLYKKTEKIILESNLSSFGAHVSKEKIIKSADHVYKSIRNSKNDIYINENNGNYKKINKSFEVNLENTFHDNIRENTIDIKMIIKKPVFVGHSKWELLYENKTYDTVIEDETFKDKLHNREIAIMSGDLLECNFKSRLTYNDENEIIESKYYILKVYAVVPPKEEEFSLID